MDRWLTLKEAVQVSGRSLSTVRRWLKRTRETDPEGWKNNVRLDTRVTTRVTTGVTIANDHREKSGVEYQEYLIREPFLLNRLGQPGRVVNDYHVTTGVTTANDHRRDHRENPPEKDQAGPDGSAVDKAGEIAFLRATVERLLEERARDRERTDLILMNLRQDIATLTARLAIQAPSTGTGAGSTWTEAEAAGPDPGPPGHQDQPEPPGPGLTLSDHIWLIGQGIKRLLNSKVF